MSELASIDRFVLLGEPGAGKSTVLAQAASDVGCAVVTARQFAGGERPNGETVFIDALEEYRVGDTARDRLNDLATALKNAPYRQWRIASRAISLPPPDAALLAGSAGAFETWQLEPLDRVEQLSVLKSLGEVDPMGFVLRIEAMAAGALLGNPATLILLRNVLAVDGTAINTRGELFARATEQMAHEINPAMPERLDRPPATRIIEAAEKACLALLLSSRSDIWALNTLSPGDHAITFSDLLPAGIDTAALRFALDTTLFRGEGGSFIPAHRVVAEYLGGRALAHATMSNDPDYPALPLRRALALLSANDDRPAPGMTGIFAWFVTTLANDPVHADAALELVRQNPEAVLFQGDAALLPTRHRLALLDAAGRDDPWFLGAAQGSTAVGGLAGDDLAGAIAAVLHDPTESTHRRAMVLEALVAGQRVETLLPTLREFALDRANLEWLRRLAIRAFVAGSVEPNRVRRELLNALSAEPAATSTVLRLGLLPDLVGVDATATEVRQTLLDYEATGEGVMGYARPLADALYTKPMFDLFDQSIPVLNRDGNSRRVEIRAVINRIFASTIIAAKQLSPDRLLQWLENVGLSRYEAPEKDLKAAIQFWLDAGPERTRELFWAMVGRADNDFAWRVGHDFTRLTGREVPDSLRRGIVDRIESGDAGEKAGGLIDLAVNLIATTDEQDIYWRLWRILNVRPEAKDAFRRLSQTSVDENFYGYKELRAERIAEIEERQASAQTWLIEHASELKSGEAQQALLWAAEIYCGVGGTASGEKGLDGLAAECGASNVNAIIEGWGRIAADFPVSFAEQAANAARSLISNFNFLALAWVELECEKADEVDVNLDVAFAILVTSYAIHESPHIDRIEGTAVRRILRDQVSEAALLEFWLAAIRCGTNDLPCVQTLERLGGQPAEPLETLLRNRPILREGTLRQALTSAVKILPADTLRELAAHALALPLPMHAQQLWRFVAFMLDPLANEHAFSCEFSESASHKLFDRMNNALMNACDAASQHHLVREEIIIRHLGPLYPPAAHRNRWSGDFSESIASSIQVIANSPTAEASDALERLAVDPNLAPWSETLRHKGVMQAALRRQTDFRPPSPKAIAKALNSGPPATAADLRAVVGEVLADLARDFRDGDTSPWRGFWNRPAGKTKNPKIENDCRDLLTDRLRDRLARYGLTPRRFPTEARSANDRRVDLLVVGDGDAALPIEVKRHNNDELWKAPQDQLLPYARSARSNGHGIYLIFWFGTVFASAPGRPGGGPKIEHPEDLRQALFEHLSAEQQATIDVVVMDVSPA